MRILDWYIAALTALAVETVLSAKVPVTSCPLNHYAVLNDDGSGISACLVCDSCLQGYGVVRPCSPTENTVCGLCPLGTFSTTISAEDRCKPCKICHDVGMVRECSPISDTVCMESCTFGEYYNPATRTCVQCSYCFPDRPYARTARVIDCQRQGLDIDYQCSPLPGTDAVDVAHPLVVTADRHRSETAARRHRGRKVHTSTAFETGQTAEISGRRISGQSRHGTRTNNGETIGNVYHSVVPLFRTTEGPSLYEGTTARSDKIFHHLRTDMSATSGKQVIATKSFLSGDQDSSNIEVTEISVGKDKHVLESVPRTGNQESIIPYYQSMTSTDIVLLIVIVIILILISIVLTALSCYCWMRRGKNRRGQRVKSVSAKPPANAWTYQDIMPATTELRPLVKDTPPQSRKLITCV